MRIGPFRQCPGTGEEVRVEVRLGDEHRATAVTRQLLHCGGVRLGVAFGIDHDHLAVE
jgi:hypothetical protein